MSIVLKVVEKVVGEPDRLVSQLKLVSQRVVASDVVAQHLTSEIEQENRKRQRHVIDHQRVSSFLVGITSHPTEAALNARKKPSKPAALDPKQELPAALAAIQDHQVIMLFDERQIDDLTTELTVTDTSEVVFLRLVPLIGG